LFVSVAFRRFSSAYTMAGQPVDGPYPEPPPPQNPIDGKKYLLDNADDILQGLRGFDKSMPCQYYSEPWPTQFDKTNNMYRRFYVLEDQPAFLSKLRPRLFLQFVQFCAFKGFFLSFSLAQLWSLPSNLCFCMLIRLFKKTKKKLFFFV
jgi:hypothetical protein